MNKEDRYYLVWRCCVNWPNRYLQYIDEWIDHTTQQQRDYMLGVERKHLIDRGIYKV